MNNKQALYLLWSTILNQSQKAEQVLKNTTLLESAELELKILDELGD